MQDVLEIQNLTNDKCNFLLLGEMCDYVTDDHATHMPLLPDDYNSDEVIPRRSQDKAVNSNGHLLLDFLKETGLRVANGWVCEDKHIGSFTYVGSRGSSLVDYCIVNPVLLNEFSSFYVHDPNILSDHCLIEFSLFSMYQRPAHIDTSNEQEGLKYFKWNNDRKDEYNDFLSTDNFKISLSSLAEDINIASNGEDIDNSITSFSDIMNTCCVPSFERHINNSQSKSQNVNKSRNTVFDEACGEKKKEFFKHLNAYRKNKNDENRANLVSSRSAYKTCTEFQF